MAGFGCPPRPDDFDSRIEFADFLSETNRFQAAQEQYERCLFLARSRSDDGRIALTLNNLGALQRDQNRIEDARKAFEEALAIRRKLAASNPDTYLPYVALTRDYPGNLHCDQNRMEEARKAYVEALAMFRMVAASDPDTYLPYVALVLSGIGRLDLATHNPEQAGAALTEARDIYARFAERDAAQYGPLLQRVKKDLANVAQ